MIEYLNKSGAALMAQAIRGRRSIYSCTCTTAATVAAKVATLVDSDAFYLEQEGTVVAVKYNSTNTTGFPTLQVGSGAAHAIAYNGRFIADAASSSEFPQWVAGVTGGTSYYMLTTVQNIQYWLWIGHDQDMNNKYDFSVHKVELSSANSIGSGFLRSEWRPDQSIIKNPERTLRKWLHDGRPVVVIDPYDGTERYHLMYMHEEEYENEYGQTIKTTYASFAHVKCPEGGDNWPLAVFFWNLVLTSTLPDPANGEPGRNFQKVTWTQNWNPTQQFLAPVAASGNYNDLINKPNVDGIEVIDVILRMDRVVEMDFVVSKVQEIWTAYADNKKLPVLNIRFGEEAVELTAAHTGQEDTQVGDDIITTFTIAGTDLFIVGDTIMAWGHEGDEDNNTAQYEITAIDTSTGVITCKLLNCTSSPAMSEGDFLQLLSANTYTLALSGLEFVPQDDTYMLSFHNIYAPNDDGSEIYRVLTLDLNTTPDNVTSSNDVVIRYAADRISNNYDQLSSRPTLNTNNASAQTVNSGETITGTIKLHKISKTGAYGDLRNRPILKTNNTTAQSTSSSETITGTINLHQVAKTGAYGDLIGAPTAIPVATVEGWFDD